MATVPAFGAAGAELAFAASTSAAIAVPAGVASGHTILVFLYKENSNAVTPPAGFTELPLPPAATGTGAHTLHAFEKTASGADAGTYSFSWTGSVNRTGVALRWTGATLVADQDANASTSSSTSFPIVGYSAPGSGYVTIWAGGQSSAAAITPPTGFTERHDSSGRLGVATLDLTTQAIDGGTAITNMTGMTGANSAHTSWSIRLRPTVAAPSGVSAGADTTVLVGQPFARSGTVTDDGGLGNTYAWTVLSGPADVAETLSTAPAISYTPTFPGTYVMRFGANNTSGLTVDDATMTVPALTTILDGVGLGVQIAWGADLADDPSTWVWTDITTDVRQSNGEQIQITMGRADEADTTQPATCQMLLDNRTGDYSLGGQSANWPYVRRNTPLTVILQLEEGGTPVTLFEGFIASWSPDWDPTGTDAIVSITAAGTLRRLEQSTAPLISAYKRATLAEDDVVAYWPMEDGRDARSIAAAVGTSPTYDMIWSSDYADPVFRENDAFLCSEPLPTIGGALLYAPVPRYTSTDFAQVRMLISFPDSGITDGQALFFVDVSGSSDWWFVEYRTGGSLAVVCIDRNDDEQVNTGAIGFDVDGRTLLLSLELTDDGGEIDWRLLTLEPGAPVGDLFTGSTADDRSLGTVQAVWLNSWRPDDDGVAPAEPTAPTDADFAVGHVVVTSALNDIFTNATELAAFDGEASGTRLARILDESGINVTIDGTESSPANPVIQVADYMGPQFSRDVLTLLRDIEAVDGGVLHDGIDFGLTYIPRRARYNRPVDLTLNAASGHLLPPFSPVDDDQQQANRVTVQRSGGSEVTVEDATGDLGTATIGVYDKSVQLNVGSPEAALHNAGWRVHQGTIVGYRYPELHFSLAKSTSLREDWCAVPLGGRIDVTNLFDARTQLPGDDQTFALEGYTQMISQKTWDVIANVSPGEAYRIAEACTDSSSTGEDVSRADTDGSTLNSSMAVGATSISVATAGTEPLWTTAAAQYPMTLDVGGIPVTATACSGASSPQTFTVTGSTVTHAKAAGVRVRLWQPAIAAL